MSDAVITQTDKRGVATVTLSRPDVHNAFNDALIVTLKETFQALGQDPKVRAIVLTGAGKSFSAGADLNWMKAAASYSQAENEADAMRLSDMLEALNTCPKPTIACVQGVAMGGGVGLVACCDVAIAIAGAKFALSEVRLGLTPATIAPYVIAKIGQSHARRLFLTGERFDGNAAHAVGLVHQSVEDAAALEAALDKVLINLMAGAPEAQHDAKRLIADTAGQPITDGLRQDTAKRIASRRASPEGKEGLGAFLNKRPPNWAGR